MNDIESHNRRPGNRRRRLGVAGLVCAGLVGGGAAIAASTSDAGAADGSSSGTPSAPAAPPAPSRYDDDGMITSVSSSALTVRDQFGTARTYAISSSTDVHAGTGTSRISALSSGEHVHVHGSKSGGTLRATGIDVLLAQLRGSVDSVSGNTVTITDADGFQRRMELSSSTHYTRNGKSAGRSAVRDGVVVMAQGSVDTDRTTLDATNVAVVTSAAQLPAGPAGGPPAGGPARPPAPGRGHGSGRPAPPAAPSGTPSASGSKHGS